LKPLLSILFIMRKNILKIHSVIGLITGVVVLIVSITGCLWVFKEELEDSKPKPISIYQANTGVIAPAKAKLIGEKINPNRAIHGVLYQQEHDVIEVIYYQNEPKFYQSLYIDPYSGESLGQKNHLSGFFSFVLDGHVNLWLPADIGGWIVRISVLLFLIMVISGIILWWPKTKKGRKQRLSFQWKKTTRWKRKNYDLHSVLGFYICSLAFVLAFTGSVMAFDWFYYITYKAWGGDKNPAFVIPNVPKDANTSSDTKQMDLLIPNLKSKYSNANNFELHYPNSDSSAVYVEIGYSNLHYSNDYKFFDPQTLKEIHVDGIYGSYEDADIADLVIRANYDIHIGAIGGILGKILAFIISLLSASLPITGFLMWYGRRKKKN